MGQKHNPVNNYAQAMKFDLACKSLEPKTPHTTEPFSSQSFSLHHIYYATEHWKITLTHWGRVTHICVSNGGRQAIIWINAGILLIGPLGTNFSEIFIKIHTFSFKKMRLKMSSGKWRPSCLGLNVLKPERHSPCDGNYFRTCDLREWGGMYLALSSMTYFVVVSVNVETRSRCEELHRQQATFLLAKEFDLARGSIEPGTPRTTDLLALLSFPCIIPTIPPIPEPIHMALHICIKEVVYHWLNLFEWCRLKSYSTL